jgi:hypothetical protein
LPVRAGIEVRAEVEVEELQRDDWRRARVARRRA